MTRKALVPVVLPADPAAAMEAATKQYVDGKAGPGPNFITPVTVAPTTDVVPLTLTRGTDASPTAHLLDIKNKAGAVLTAFDQGGNLQIATINAGAQILVAPANDLTPLTITRGTDAAPTQRLLVMKDKAGGTLTSFDQNGNLVIAAIQSQVQSIGPVNDTTPLTITRGTDTSPTQDLLTFKNHAGSPIAAIAYDGSITSTNLGGLNHFDNGSLTVWQRGTTFTPPAAGVAAYIADRWRVVSAGAALGQIQQGGSATFYGGPRYNISCDGAAGVTTVNFGQRMEAETVFRLLGTTGGSMAANAGSVTFSFVCAMTTGTPLTLLLGTPAAVDDFTTVTNRLTATLNGTPTSGGLFLVSYTIPVATLAAYAGITNGLQVELQVPSGQMVAGKVFNFYGGKAEVGSVPTPFSSLPYAQELSRCQRHYYRLTGVINDRIGSGVYNAATSALCFLYFPATMRKAPTLSYGSQSMLSMLGAVSVAGTAIATGAGANPQGAQLTVTCAGATAGQACLFYFNTATNAWIAASADL